MHAVVRRGCSQFTRPLSCVSVVLARDGQMRDFKNVVRCEAFVLVVDESLL